MLETGKLSMFKEVDIETQREAIHDIASMNIMQMLMQMMLNGTIEMYAYRCQCAMTHDHKVKARGLEKHLYIECDKVVGLLKMKNKAIADYVLRDCYTMACPDYWRDYAKEIDSSQAYQRRFYDVHRSKVDSLYYSVKNMLYEDGMVEGADTIACIIVLEACANVGAQIINETFDLMVEKGRANGINIMKQNTHTYERLMFACHKLIDKRIGDKCFKSMFVGHAEKASENFQCSVASGQTIGVMNAIIDTGIKDYLDYSLARISMDGMSDGIRDFFGKRTKVPVKVLMKQLKNIKGDMDDVWDIADAIRESKNPMIEELKKTLCEI